MSVAENAVITKRIQMVPSANLRAASADLMMICANTFPIYVTHARPRMESLGFFSASVFDA